MEQKTSTTHRAQSRPHLLNLTGSLACALSASVFLMGCFEERTAWQPQEVAAPAPTAGGQSVSTGGVVAQGSAADQQQQLSTLFLEHGMTSLGPVIESSLTTNGLTAYAIEATAGTCYQTSVSGEVPGQDLNLVVIDPMGRTVAHDVRPDNHPWAGFCAAQAGRFIVRLQMVVGAGGYLYSAYASADGQRMDLAGFYGQAPETTADGLQENFALLDADMRARGYVSLVEHTTSELAAGGAVDFNVQLEGGRCYAILAVGGTGVQDLDLVLSDAGGRLIDQDVGERERPIVRVCPSANGRYSMRVQMQQGSGSFIYAPYRWPRGIHGPFGLEGLSWVRASEVTTLLGVEGYTPDPGFTPQSGQLSSQSSRGSQRVDLLAGQCYAVLVVGGQGVSELGLSLSFAGQQVATTHSLHSAFPSVRYCPQQEGTYDVGIVAQVGQGTYHIQLFTQSEQEG